MTVESEFGMLKLNLFGVHTRPKSAGVRTCPEARAGP